MSQHEYPLKDYLNSINIKQGDLSGDERAMKKYPAFVINKCLSSFIDTVMHANEMNAGRRERNEDHNMMICDVKQRVISIRSSYILRSYTSHPQNEMDVNFASPL